MLAKAALMYYGHDPRAIDEYAWRDVETFLAALPALQAAGNPFTDS
jgi:hypothetical protein